MASATLRINVIPKRLLEKKEAAHHCGRSVRRFEIECPCSRFDFRTATCAAAASIGPKHACKIYALAGPSISDHTSALPTLARAPTPLRRAPFFPEFPPPLPWMA